MDSEEEQRTVWVGNLADDVTDEILYELFLQAGPLQRVRIPTDKQGKRSNFGFVTFKHLASVQYAVQLLDGIELYKRMLTIKPRSRPMQNRRDYEIYPQQLLNPMVDLNMLLHAGSQMLLQNNRGMHDNGPWERNRDYREERRRDDKPYRNVNHSNSGNSSHYRGYRQQNRTPYNQHDYNRRHRR